MAVSLWLATRVSSEVIFRLFVESFDSRHQERTKKSYRIQYRYCWESAVCGLMWSYVTGAVKAPRRFQIPTTTTTTCSQHLQSKPCVSSDAHAADSEPHDISPHQVTRSLQSNGPATQDTPGQH